MNRKTTVTGICGLLLILGLALLPTAAAAEAPAGWKEATLEQMEQVELDIQGVRIQLASNPSDAKGLALLGDLLGKLEALSASMGGDRPVPRRSEARPGNAPAFAPPPTCAASASTFTNSTALAIPTGPAVVSSTIAVSGAGSFLWDVDLTTFLTHTFAADLDITIQSPAGTIVTLTTDNGAGNDDVFNGTLWDDSANPGGQVPYTSNSGMATDHPYVNLTPVSTLVPEEALGAFFGEDPNGTWTITISDDLSGDGGNLASWSLSLTTFAAPPIETAFPFSSSAPVAILDTGVVTSTIAVSGAGTSLSGLTLTTLIEHTFAADLDITLQSPAGTVVTITTDNGSGNDNVFNGTVWSDGADPDGQVPYTTNNGMVTDQTYANLTLATPLVPEEAFGAFLGEDPNGTWTLTISDDLTGDGGTLTSWSLGVTTATCCPEISVSPSTLPPFLAGAYYNQVISASGGTGPYTFAITGGSLPSGVTLAADGVLSGTPSVSGEFSFAVTATDANGCTGTLGYYLSGEAYNVSFMDDRMRTQACVNSYTGDWQFIVFPGSQLSGLYSGAGTVYRTGKTYRYDSVPASGPRFNLIYNEAVATAKGTLILGFNSCLLSDLYTFDDPPCGDGGSPNFLK